MKNKVFVSYSYQDLGFISWLKTNLKDLDIEFWNDTNEVFKEENIKEKINQGIRLSDAIILVLSATSLNSNWVKYEMSSALLLNAVKMGIKIIPITIDNSTIPADLAGYQYIDFSSQKEKALETLKRALQLSKKVNFEFTDWSGFSPKRFEDMIFDLVRNEGLNVRRTAPTRDGGYDFIGEPENNFGFSDKLLVQVKFYKENKISIETLRQLYGVAMAESATKVLLVTSSELTFAAREYARAYGPRIVVWEGHDVISKLFSHPALIDRYFGMRDLMDTKRSEILDSELENVQQLLKKMDDCPEGTNGWKEYEDICIEILIHLFVPPLGEPKIQSRRESGIDIRDAIFPNRSSNNENWKFIRDDYEARYIVFEFKNYAENGSEIDKHVLLQIGDYLKKDTIGRFGIICSRKAPNQSGLEKRKDIFIENKKLILFLNNGNLKEMLLRKYKNLDPSDVIIDLIDEFNLKF
ncbi:MAG: hypothetical protein DI535_03810 [Citrobacter freundii]|nr:MAG: hypothetical protein DI535_03810 [Citrobacter freundii]